jgi:exodeoxyribonuclease III
LPQKKDDARNGKQMKIISWNVNGIRASYEKGLNSLVQEHKPDILCLQETKAHIDQVSPQMKSLGYKNFHWSSAIRKGYSGVATFTNFEINSVKFNFGDDEYKSLYENEGRIVHSVFPKFELYNIYFPNGGSGEERHQFKQLFLKRLNHHLEKEIAAGKSIIVVGDYNVAHNAIDVYDPIRLSKESGFLPEEQEWMTAFLKLGMVDSFRYFSPKQKDRYSWWSYRELARAHNRGWRIDYICVTKNLIKYMRSAQILDQWLGSDHAPCVIDLEI